MKKYSVLMFVIGVLISLAALFADHAVEIRFVLRCIAPKYYHADAGLKILAKERELKKGAEGYSEISVFLLERARSVTKLSADKWRDFDFKIECLTIGGAMQIGNENFPDAIWFRLSSNHPDFGGFYGYAGPAEPNNFIWGLSQLRDKVDELKDPNILIFCISVFLVGILFEAFAFYLERAEAKSQIAEAGMKSLDSKAVQ